jgi:hypothetical protein
VAERLDRLLLDAALARPEQAAGPWAALRDQLEQAGGVDALRGDRQHLLGLVHATAVAANDDGPIVRRLAGATRHIWTANQLSLKRLKVAFDALEDQRPLITGDAALAAGCGLRRPIHHLALQVQPDRHAEAVTCLKDHGWIPAPTLPPRSGPSMTRFDGLVLTSSVGADGVRMDLVGCEGRRVDDSSLLVGQLADHSGWHPRPAPLRIVDIVLTSRRLGPDDWGTALDHIRERHLVISARRRLNAADLPATVRDAIAAMPVDGRDRATAWAERYSSTLADHIDRTRDESPWGAVAALPRAFQDRWGSSSPWQLPLEAGRRVSRRTRLPGRMPPPSAT